MTEQLALTATPSNGRGLFDASLSELEAVIERGLETFVEVGLALLAIRDGKKYRENYSTFDDYCRERWGWSRQRGYQLMDAAKMSTIVDIENEAQARELAPLQDEAEVVEVWRELKEEHGDKVVAADIRAAVERRMAHVGQNTGESEWYTPAEYIASAARVMGGIDLDPASHPAAQETIRADRFFTLTDDGLSQAWEGRIWLNPPYAQPTIWHFVEKLVAELSSGNATEAILLTHNYTDTTWFHHAESIAAAICFTRGRIRFIDADGEDGGAPTQGQAFFYYGETDAEFRSVFSDFGFIR
ncbi:hypothetical protein LCGC14_1560810 [marine sediment metagenome]|uniref:DNA N-6-adenine-methyltransferase (Dam) n=1 Tax=marine sediment metagenome TaxID=412755 RepID=A0A0F9IMK0_9ZZZZ